MVKRTLDDPDIREALQVLEAIQTLQRWLVHQPMGADGLYLSPRSRALVQGQDVVASIDLAPDAPCKTT